MYRKVLLATDLSERAGAAARVARHLATSDAEARAILVLPHVSFHRATRRVEGGNLEEEALRLHEKDAEKLLASVVEGGPFPDAEVVVRRGSVGATVAGEAEGWGADLVVVGATGASQARRLLLGSSARAILRRVGCDTLVARGPGDEPPGTLLVASDLQAPSRVAGRKAIELAAPGARVIVVHAIDPSTWSGIAYETASTGVDPAWLDENVGGLLHDYNMNVLGGRAEEVVCHGRTAAQVTDHAAAMDVDLLVAGSHGEGMLSRAILGSVAEAIVERATCSVLVVRPGPPS